MQCLRRCILSLIGVSAAFTAVALICSLNLATWLADADKAEVSDAMVVLAGDPTRAFEAAELYRGGFAKKVLLPAAVTDWRIDEYAKIGLHVPRQEEIVEAILKANDVPESAITRVGKELTSTIAEAEAVRAMLQPMPRTLLVVTSPYHTRRTRMIYEKTLPGVAIRVVASRYEPYPEHWWTNKDAARDIVLEVTRIMFYLVGGRF